MARYEYRVFPQDVETVLGRFDELLQRGEDESKRDLYLVDRDRLTTNLKVRDDHLEIKTLSARDGELQLWQPQGEHPFPLQPATAERWLPDLEPAAYELASLVQTASRSGYRVITVIKERRNYGADGLDAEYTRLTTDRDQRCASFSLEHENPEELRDWIRRTGLDAWPNLSYPEFLGHGH